MVNSEQFLSMLSYILKHGNVTVYEWEHGEPPVQDQNQNAVTEDASIDWGLDSGVSATQDDGIDFGEIDFGDSVLGENDLTSITLEESGIGGVAPQAEDGGVAPQAGDGGVAEVTSDDAVKYSGKG